MAETAHAYTDPSSATQDVRPALKVVREDRERSADAGTALEADYWHRAAVGAALGFSLFVIVITVVGTLAGIGAGGALGLAVFVGAFGGIGFGFMIGGLASFGRQFDARPATATTHEHGESR